MSKRKQKDVLRARVVVSADMVEMMRRAFDLLQECAQIEQIPEGRRTPLQRAKLKTRDFASRYKASKEALLKVIGGQG